MLTVYKKKKLKKKKKEGWGLGGAIFYFSCFCIEKHLFTDTNFEPCFIFLSCFVLRNIC